MSACGWEHMESRAPRGSEFSAPHAHVTGAHVQIFSLRTKANNRKKRDLVFFRTNTKNKYFMLIV
jgi:hypothetical protein